MIAGLFSQLFGQINTAGTMRGKLNKYSKTADRHYPRFRNNVYKIPPSHFIEARGTLVDLFNHSLNIPEIINSHSFITTSYHRHEHPYELN